MSFWIDNPHSQSLDQICKAIRSNIAGLSTDEATKRLKEFGPNQLPIARQSTVASVFIKQFINPLIYILLLVSVISIFIGHATDAGFILVILIMNAAIGTFQAYHAERGALALRQLSTTKAIVERSGENFDIDSKDIVVGDLVHLESGVKVPADLRLISSHTLQIDESLLTGESLTVFKEYGAQIPIDTPLGDRKTMAFAGTLVTRGRGEGLVVAIASDTVLGQIAHTVMQRVSTKTPLVIRMERLTKGLAIALFFIVLAIGTMFFLHGEPLANVLILSVALGVAAIPEGLPVAITVALAIASKRMARKQVLVRNLSSVEALGSCTYIGTDKTGTLTMNELTAKAVVFPMLNPLEITGTGLTPEGKFIIPSFTPQNHIQRMIKRVSETVVLCNEGVLSMRDKKWVGHGDAVDLALLVMAHKAGVTSGKLFLNFQPVSELPFESEHKFSATLHRSSDGQVISVKGALETLLPMCSRMMILSGDIAIDHYEIEKLAATFLQFGYRVLAVASGQPKKEIVESLTRSDLHDLTFLGLVAMIDPLRPEAKDAVRGSQNAGVQVAMITGDHPMTALAIAKELELATTSEEIVTGTMLSAAQTPDQVDELVRRGKVFARVEPQQKLEIVKSLIRQHHFVAITGDGANDAPALKAAHVGVAMGKSGTDVARETADLIITDDRFSSLVAGIEEGRVAYANIRRVIYVLISTSTAEIILFVLSIIAGLPPPLTAVQLLWLNLVTDGIQVIALAFEPAEGMELQQAPRSPKEHIFNKIMLERVGISALVMSIATFLVYSDLIQSGVTDFASRNHLLLLMVLFENVMIGNARSETKSTFALSPLRNPFLLFATAGALALHVASMHTPTLASVLGVSPLSFSEWGKYLLITPVALLAIELHKYARWLWNSRTQS